MTYREARMQAAALLKAAGVENEAAESWFLIEADQPQFLSAA